ncbi:MAG TPA: S9 family peptidase [Vicinamibacterales bacterium]|nr:S9 family peptidase [Vicinamibacterales bacterium]
MRRTLRLLACHTILAGSLLAAAGAPPLTTRDLYRLRSVGDVQLSPDGKRVAYTVQNAEGPGTPYPELWVADVASGKAFRVGAHDASAWNPRWSSDGARLAYFGIADGGVALSVVDARRASDVVSAPGERVAIVSGTNHPLPSEGEAFAWSPDGKRIAFVSSTPADEEPGGDPIVITRYLYKPPASSADFAFNDNRRLHIFVVDLATRTVRQLTRGEHYEHSIDWSPTSEEILFVSNREPHSDRVFNYDLYAVRVSDGAERRLTRTPSAEYYPRWSPDGRSIAFLATKRDRTSSETTMEDTHVYVMNAAGAERREAAAGIDNRHGAPKWVGTEVAFTVQERGLTALYRGDRRLPIDGSIGAWSIAGDTIAAALTTRDHPSQLLIGTSLQEQNGFLRERAIATVEAFRFKSFDGLEIEAFVTKPVPFEPARKYPLVAAIHGGPHAQQGPWFNAKAQIYAGEGFATLMVNYRGSTGYGQAFADAIFGDQNGGEAKDVLSGVSAAIAKYPWIDRGALFVEGVSYGGQLTNWLITQTDRFRAAAPLAGISNLVSFNYMAYYHDYLAVEFGGYPHEKGLIDTLWERSPLRYAKDVKTPTLFLHGENDNDVPVAEAEQFYIALKDVGVETVMVRYPREGHGLRETAHVADAIDRILAWYRKHRGGEPEPAFASGPRTLRRGRP